MPQQLSKQGLQCSIKEKDKNFASVCKGLTKDLVLHVLLQPDTASDVGDNSSDTRNAGTDLNSCSYQIMLAGWAAVCLHSEGRLVHRMKLLRPAPPWRTHKQKPEQILPRGRDNPAH